MPPVSRGFRGRRPAEEHARRLPPGQYATEDFPVLSTGPTPRDAAVDWSLALTGAVEALTTWTWEEFLALGVEEITTDIHCVTQWSKFDTRWAGISVDRLLAVAGVRPEATHVLAHAAGGYTTNLPLADVTGGRAWIAHRFDGEPLAPAHGGPARLLVPHLYFWKSAKWVRELELLSADRRGFWEDGGYHDRGDPWREQRYQGD
jgi:DMSO/TMAO reductase YedYZ molybdopterin-dependent catalytic subunit